MHTYIHISPRVRGHTHGYLHAHAHTQQHLNDVLPFEAQRMDTRCLTKVRFFVGMALLRVIHERVLLYPYMRICNQMYAYMFA